MKIRIIGAPGSGKSTLAAKLSKEYGIPHFDLDDIQWENSSGSYGIKTPSERRTELLNEILSLDDWIIEGVYYAWCQNTFEQADRTILLDVPKSTCKRRIIMRFIKRRLGLEKGRNETFKSLRALLKWTDKFYLDNMKEIERIFVEDSIKNCRGLDEILNAKGLHE